MKQDFETDDSVMDFVLIYPLITMYFDFILLLIIPVGVLKLLSI